MLLWALLTGFARSVFAVARTEHSCAMSSVGLCVQGFCVGSVSSRGRWRVLVAEATKLRPSHVANEMSLQAYARGTRCQWTTSMPKYVWFLDLYQWILVHLRVPASRVSHAHVAQWLTHLVLRVFYIFCCVERILLFIFITGIGAGNSCCRP